jgi:thiosulfate/3-mercaptopyruvate sulfurtransferase
MSNPGYTNPEALVSTEWLAEHLNAPDVRIIDASHHLPTAGRNAKTEYDQQHIPGAIFWDIDAMSDPSSDLPHMLPDADQFARQVGALGIGDGHKVIIYDTVSATGAARVWWTFRVFGFRDVAVLNGGFRKWTAETRPVTADVEKRSDRNFTARKNHMLVRDREQMLRNIDLPREQVVDARAAGRFLAQEPEPRAGMRGGHIPGSMNVPFPALLNKDGTYRDGEVLRAAFAQAGVDLAKPMATTCGSGVTACTLALGLYLIGQTDVAVYDGSWSEWGSRQDTPVETTA